MPLPPILRKVLDSLHAERSAAVDLLHSDIQDLIRAIREQTNTNKESRGEPKPVIATLSTPVTVAIQEQPQRKPNVWQVLFKGVEVLGIGAAIVYAILTFLMWKEMIVGTDAAYRSAEQARKATYIASHALMASQLSANAAQDNVRLVEQQTEQQDRPYVKFEFTPDPANSNKEAHTIHIYVGQPIVFPATYTNIGRGPARKVYGEVFVELVKWNEEPHLTLVKPQKGNYPRIGFFAAMMFPGEKVHQEAVRMRRGRSIWGDMQPDLLTQPELDSYNSGKSYFAIYGIIRYEDVFRVSHWTRYCNWLPASKITGAFNAHFCTEFNDADSNQARPSMKGSSPLIGGSE